MHKKYINTNLLFFFSVFTQPICANPRFRAAHSIKQAAQYLKKGLEHFLLRSSYLEGWREYMPATQHSFSCLPMLGHDKIGYWHTRTLKALDHANFFNGITSQKDHCYNITAIKSLLTELQWCLNNCPGQHATYSADDKQRQKQRQDVTALADYDHQLKAAIKALHKLMEIDLPTNCNSKAFELNKGVTLVTRKKQKAPKKITKKQTKGLIRKLPPINQAVNENLAHAIQRSVQRRVFATKKVAIQELKTLTQEIEKNGFPSGSFIRSKRPDGVLIPVGNNGLATYQVVQNGKAKLKTVLVNKYT